MFARAILPKQCPQAGGTHNFAGISSSRIKDDGQTQSESILTLLGWHPLFAVRICSSKARAPRCQTAPRSLDLMACRQLGEQSMALVCLYCVHRSPMGCFVAGLMSVCYQLHDDAVLADRQVINLHTYRGQAVCTIALQTLPRRPCRYDCACNRLSPSSCPTAVCCVTGA